MREFYLVLLLVWFGSAYGQIQNTSPEQYILAQRGEVYFSFSLPKQSSLEKLSKMISIDNVDKNKVFAYANKQAFRQFLQLGISYDLLDESTVKLNPTMATSMSDFMQSWNSYPTYYQYDSLMQKLANDYPDICKYHVLGTLPSGRKILALQMGDSVNIHEAEPRFLYTSSMHGNELTGYVLMLRLANYLLSNYGTNAVVDSLMNNIEIWINPLANPDGAYYGGNMTLASAKRYNANFVDLNRNYPDPDDGPHPDGKAWQAETVIFKTFADSIGFNMSANFHGGAEVANYPWDTWSKLTADDLWWKYVCHQYADSAQVNSASSYFNGPSGAYGSGVINGYQWYPIFGGRQDYMNYYQHCREVTIELSNQKLPNAGMLPFYWNANKSSLLNYMMQSQYGLHGIITDSVTKQPIEAKVFINGHDMDESHVFNRLPYGDYYRYLDSAYYSVTYSAPHYHSKTIDSVRIDRNQLTVLNVALAPDDAGIESVQKSPIKVYPNPTSGVVYILSQNEIIDYSLYSIQGKLLKYNAVNNLKKLSIDISNFPSGVYLIQIQDAEGNRSQQKIIIR